MLLFDCREQLFSDAHWHNSSEKRRLTKMALSEKNKEYEWHIKKLSEESSCQFHSSPSLCSPSAAPCYLRPSPCEAPPTPHLELPGARGLEQEAKAPARHGRSHSPFARILRAVHLTARASSTGNRSAKGQQKRGKVD
ncbi:hypothetical protein MHYP_G00338180 [Metynnis hypsauchen]